MARKNLLAGLTGAPAPSSDRGPAPEASQGSEAAPPPLPRRRTGAVGAVSRSIADLRANAVVEIPADLIDHGGLKDRLGEEAEAHAALVDSIREHGQQVPVLVRHSPNYEGRYEAVYGRRRIAALKDLGRPVRAMIRDLPDRELIVAQGQENAARRDLTFIEKANFARQMRDARFERKLICDALHIDKTVISRMLAVADAVPLALIEAIGPAPSAGRDRWIALAQRLSARPPDEARLRAWTRELARVEGSDARFDAALTATAEPRAPSPAPRPLRGAQGAALGTAREGRGGTTIRLVSEDGFDAWLVDNIEEIHRRFREERGE